mmetsp:Transcript_8074/g.14690  ORF Transcript_8074/g.14690 Transcript_8074/m.14690 type:complete len:93 (+) Transcript_8074:1064-1342(+)
MVSATGIRCTCSVSPSVNSPSMVTSDAWTIGMSSSSGEAIISTIITVQYCIVLPVCYNLVLDVTVLYCIYCSISNTENDYSMTVLSSDGIEE